MNLTSSDITKIARLMLHQRGVYCWRQNQIPVKGRRFVGEPGQSDLIGFNKYTGQFVACEVKAKGDALSDSQRDFLKMVKAAKGIAVIACERLGRVQMVDIEDYLNDKF